MDVCIQCGNTRGNVDRDWGIQQPPILRAQGLALSLSMAVRGQATGDRPKPPHLRKHSFLCKLLASLVSKQNVNKVPMCRNLVRMSCLSCKSHQNETTALNVDASLLCGPFKQVTEWVVCVLGDRLLFTFYRAVCVSYTRYTESEQPEARTATPGLSRAPGVNDCVCGHPAPM